MRDERRDDMQSSPHRDLHENRSTSFNTSDSPSDGRKMRLKLLFRESEDEKENREQKNAEK